MQILLFLIGPERRVTVVFSADAEPLGAEADAVPGPERRVTIVFAADA